MEANNIYHAMITNLEGAINTLANQIYKDLYEAPLKDVAYINYARDYCKDLSYYKCQIMKNLEKAGLLKYDKEPF